MTMSEDELTMDLDSDDDVDSDLDLDSDMDDDSDPKRGGILQSTSDRKSVV